VTPGEGIALAAAALGLVSSIVTPGLIVGKYLGGILTTQAQHTRDHERHFQSAHNQGERLEILGKEIAELRGEVRGSRDFSGAHRGG
jgi:hypothetical protein